MKRRTGTGARAWVEALEGASLQRSHPHAVEAASRFDGLASPARKMALVREIVATRAAELTLAYGNLVMVTAGYKSRTSEAGIEEVHPEPCVILVVKRKWSGQPKGKAGQRLPERLLTFGQEGRERTLYAVPTDVQPAQWFLGSIARTASCVRLDDPVAAFRLPGTLTCGVRLRGATAAAGSGFALSAMHVLSPAPEQVGPAGGTAFSAIGTDATVRGRSAAWGGHLDPVQGTGFDAQLAQVSDPAWFTGAFAGMVLSAHRPYVASAHGFDDLAATMRFQVLAPSNHPSHVGLPRPPMLAQFTAMVHEELPLIYEVRRAGKLDRVFIRHPELIRLQVLEGCPAPESGDSGSPVVSWWPDGSVVLVGMFIASGGTPQTARMAYVLPAWHLFDPLNWSGLPVGTLALTPRFSLP